MIKVLLLECHHFTVRSYRNWTLEIAEVGKMNGCAARASFRSRLFRAKIGYEMGEGQNTRVVKLEINEVEYGGGSK